MKNLLLTLALSATTSLGLAATTHNHKTVDATTLVNDNVLVGYWHNWDYAGGYQGGTARYMDLTAVPIDYNVVDVSFLKSDFKGEMPDFKPEMPNHPTWTQDQKDQEFASEVDVLHSENRKVILSLGGASANIELKSSQTSDFTNKVKELVAKYYFDGIDIDLENDSVLAGDNVDVISTSLKNIKDENKDFYITMAPEFPNLKSRAYGSFVPYLRSLKDYYNFINPQLYNQAGDGVSPTQKDKNYFLNKYGIDIGWWLPQTQSNPKLTSVFLALITKYIVTGEAGNGFEMIPADKLVLGLPASNDAANNGVVSESDLEQALVYLQDFKNNDGSPIKIKGLMTWSVNWDKNTNFRFMEMYRNLFQD